MSAAVGGLLVKHLGQLDAIAGAKVDFVLDWPALLTYLDLETVFENFFPEVPEEYFLYSLIEKAVATSAEKDLLIALYDQVFIDCLTRVQAFSWLTPAILLEKIRSKTSPLLEVSLRKIEENLSLRPYETIHDLTLYLAWDRVCVYFTVLFESLFPLKQARDTLSVFKECLIESFEHITNDQKTVPSFFRLVEAFYAYQMREENLSLHQEKEWELLCQSLSVFSLREALVEVPYIDSQQISQAFTLHASERVQLIRELSAYVVEKLQEESSSWKGYRLPSVEVVCIKDHL